MHALRATAIDIAESAYDLALDDSEWLQNLLAVGEPAFDCGVGYGASVWAGLGADGAPLLAQMAKGRGPEDLPLRFARAAYELGPDRIRRGTEAAAGTVRVLSETREAQEGLHEILTKHVGCADFLEVFAIDPDFRGVALNMHTSELVHLTPKERSYWRMLMVHIAAGHRLRRALRRSVETATPLSDLPLHADAVLDPKRFTVSEATSNAAQAEVLETIREAAVRVDAARGRMRHADPHEALQQWQGLVRGRWSMIDWFDSDGRRYMLAKPNAPRCEDPRGLTEREMLVATYAAGGDTKKFISYRLGISPSYVSSLLKSAKRKLGVKTQAELVFSVRCFRDAG